MQEISSFTNKKETENPQADFVCGFFTWQTKEVIKIIELDFYMKENGKIPVQDLDEIKKARKYMEDYKSIPIENEI